MHVDDWFAKEDAALQKNIAMEIEAEDIRNSFTVLSWEWVVDAEDAETYDEFICGIERDIYTRVKQGWEIVNFNTTYRPVFKRGIIVGREKCHCLMTKLDGVIAK